jgi:hypothetical protein
LRRDAIDFIASVYPTMPEPDRIRFEQAVGSYTPADGRKWDIYLPPLLSALPAEAIATDPIRARHRELAETGGLRANPPQMSWSIRHQSDERIADSMMADAGVNIHVEPAVSMIAALDRIESEKSALNSEQSEQRIAALWDATQAAVQLFDRGGQPEAMKPRIWGTIGEAFVELINKHDFSPCSSGQCTLADVEALLRRLAESPFPEGHGESLDWGNWEVRVYAAKGVMRLAHGAAWPRLNHRGLAS